MCIPTSSWITVCRRWSDGSVELWNVSPTYTGWQADFAIAASSEAAGTDQQRRNALARYSQVPKYLDDEIANLTEGLKLGFSAPQHNVDVVISQMDAMLKAPPATSHRSASTRPST